MCKVQMLTYMFADTDPCRDNNGGCEHRCENDNGRPVCKCYKGYVLSRDGRSCEGTCRNNFSLHCLCLWPHQSTHYPDTFRLWRNKTIFPVIFENDRLTTLPVHPNDIVGYPQ